MIILLDSFNTEILELPVGKQFVFTYEFIPEDRVRRLLDNNRCRTIFSKYEVLNAFNLDSSTQIVQVDKIKVKPYDRIILRTKNAREPFLMMEIVDADKFCPIYMRVFAKNSSSNNDRKQ